MPCTVLLFMYSYQYCFVPINIVVVWDNVKENGILAKLYILETKFVDIVDIPSGKMSIQAYKIRKLGKIRCFLV